MNKLLRHLIVIIALLCGLLGSGIRVKVQEVATNQVVGEVRSMRPDRQDRLWGEEPQSPLSDSMRKPPSSHRIVSTRTSRLLPTQGGKSGHSSDRWANGHSSNLLNHLPSLLCQSPLWLGIVAPSPRLYYVIALRRLLC